MTGILLSFQLIGITSLLFIPYHWFIISIMIPLLQQQQKQLYHGNKLMMTKPSPPKQTTPLPEQQQQYHGMMMMAMAYHQHHYRPITITRRCSLNSYCSYQAPYRRGISYRLTCLPRSFFSGTSPASWSSSSSSSSSSSTWIFLSRLLDGTSRPRTCHHRYYVHGSSSNNYLIHHGSAMESSSPSATGGDDQEEDFHPLIQHNNTPYYVPKKFIPYPFEYHEEVTVKIETLTNRGWGVGRIILSPEQRIKLEQQKQQQQSKQSSGYNTKRIRSKPKSDDDEMNHLLSSINQQHDENDDDDETTYYLTKYDDKNENTYPPDKSNNIREDLSSTNNDGQTNLENQQQPQHSKWVIMVPYVIPDELVRVRIYRNFPKYSHGDLIEIIESSSYRISNPPCPYFGEQQCGGCQYQHIDIHYQRRWKTIFVQQALQQYDINDSVVQKVEPCIGTKEIYSYRSKITPHYQAPNTKSKQKQRDDADGIKSTTTTSTTTKDYSTSIQAIGFQKVTSRSIIDIESCMIATDAINEKYQEVRSQILSSSGEKQKYKKGATLLFRQGNLHDNSTEVTTNHKKYITTTVSNNTFLYQAGNFFQNNYYVLPLMIQHVLQQAIRPSLLSRKDMTHLIDCYCGSGLFAISLAKYFHNVIGIELNTKAIMEATYNAQYNNITNYQFVSSTASDIFQYVTQYPVNETVVIIDPPRKGCSIEFLQQLYHYQPQRIIYMSCDPITQARDAAILLQQQPRPDDSTYYYEITSIQPFDLFPQTRHIECLMIFEKNLR